jgi:hypothetical protein
MADTEIEKESERATFYKIRRILARAVLFFKLASLIFILCIIGTFTFENTAHPYSYYLVGLEITIAALICIMSLKMYTYRPMKNLIIPSNFSSTDEDAKFLWMNLSIDINRYEQAASYYLNGVKSYKYSTIFLAGISTAVLGLDLGKSGPLEYAVLAKNIALVIGAMITVSTSLFTYWNIEKYWLINKTIANKLRALRHDLETASAKGDLEKQDGIVLEEIFKKYADTKETFYKYWEGALSERNSQNSAQK